MHGTNNVKKYIFPIGVFRETLRKCREFDKNVNKFSDRQA
jgi:hypothetical protein